MAKKKILVVDDEKDCCKLLQDYFIKFGHIVYTAHDGDKAAELLNLQTFDYVFLDCSMPGLTGVELIKVIKEKSPGAKMIMISGYELINEDLAKELGIDLFIRKPFSLEKIMKEIIKNA
ncbi:MAG: response regulator [Candidatus Omnitrophota bacterium]